MEQMELCKSSYINWTETARLQLIEAVIQVEEEIEYESNLASRARSGKELSIFNRVAEPVYKWERVANRLPLELQGKVWSNRENNFEDRRKCRVMFDDLVKSYRDVLAGRNTTHARRRISRPVWEMLKRREDLLESRTAFRAEIEGRASERLSLGMATERATTLYLEQAKGSDSAGDDLRYEEIEEHHRDRGKIGKRCLVRTSADHKQPKRSMKGCKDPQNTCKARIQVQAGARSRRQERDPNSCRRRPAGDSRASWSEKDMNTSMTHTSNDDDLQPILDGLLRRQELELCRLGSWLHTQSIPVWRTVMKRMTSSALLSRKRRKLSVGRATESDEEDLQESLSRMLDLRVRASFQKLRFRISQVVESTSMELAQELLQDTNSPKDFPTSSPAVRGRQH